MTSEFRSEHHTWRLAATSMAVRLIICVAAALVASCSARPGDSSSTGSPFGPLLRAVLEAAVVGDSSGVQASVVDIAAGREVRTFVVSQRALVQRFLHGAQQVGVDTLSVDHVYLTYRVTRSWVPWHYDRIYATLILVNGHWKVQWVGGEPRM